MTMAPNGKVSDKMVRRLAGELMAPLFRNWGDALKFCRQERGLKYREVASFVGVSEGQIQLWEYGDSVPPSNKMVRLHKMMNKLAHFRHLLHEGAINKADRQQKEDEKRAAEKRPEPQPEQKPMLELPPVKRSLSDALSILRRTRGLSAREISHATGLSPSSINIIERGVDAMQPDTYRALVDAYPELASATPPVLKIGRGAPITAQEALDPTPVAPAPLPLTTSTLQSEATMAQEPGVATFAVAVRVARAKRGLDMGEFGKLAGLSRSFISGIEGGRDKVQARAFQALLIAFPELADAPLPSVVGSHGFKHDARSFLPPRPKADATAASPVSVVAAVAPAATSAGNDARSPSGTTGLAQALTEAYGWLADARKRADETMEIALKADAEKKAAEAAVDKATAALQAAMGLSK